MRRHVRRVPAASSSPHVADSSMSPLLMEAAPATPHEGRPPARAMRPIGVSAGTEPPTTASPIHRSGGTRRCRGPGERARPRGDVDDAGGRAAQAAL